MPLTLDGGAFSYVSRSGTNGFVSLGNLNLAAGASDVLVNVGGTSGLGTASVNFNSLATRSPGATLNFAASGGAIGDNPFVTFSTAPTLVNGIIGGWATVTGLDDNAGGSNAEFATYDPATGVRALTGSMLTTLTVANTLATNATPTANVRIGSTLVQTVAAGGETINSLTMSSFNSTAAASTISFANTGDTLTLASGGLLSGTDSAGRNIGTSAVRGQLTTGATQPELFLHNGANTLTIYSKIIDNGVAGGMNVVLDAMSQTATIIPTVALANANTYQGTTYVNGIAVNLVNTTGAGNAIPGNLIITGGNNNGTDSLAIANVLVQNLASEQIADTATVTVRGGSQYSTNGFAETIGNLVFNSQGGSNGGNGPQVSHRLRYADHRFRRQHHGDEPDRCPRGSDHCRPAQSAGDDDRDGGFRHRRRGGRQRPDRSGHQLKYHQRGHDHQGRDRSAFSRRCELRRQHHPFRQRHQRRDRARSQCELRQHDD
ncbi:MAG: hypothetical protein WDN28_29210 [Chthoniobacter sp.]